MQRPQLTQRKVQPAEYQMLGFNLDGKTEMWVHPDTYNNIMSGREEGNCMGAAQYLRAVPARYF